MDSQFIASGAATNITTVLLEGDQCNRRLVQPSDSSSAVEAIAAEIDSSTGTKRVTLIYTLARCGDVKSVRPLLKLFASGDWESLRAARSGLLENFEREQFTVTAKRLLKENESTLPMMELLLEPLFYKDWNDLDSEDTVTLFQRLAQLSRHADVREKAMYDGLQFIKIMSAAKTNLSKFSACMNKRECELKQLDFLYRLASPKSLCRAEAIAFLLECVCPGTSLLSKNRAKLGLKTLAIDSGLPLLTEELAHGSRLEKINAAQLLARTRNSKAIVPLLEAFSHGDNELRETIKSVLDRYFADAYEWYQTGILA